MRFLNASVESVIVGLSLRTGGTGRRAGLSHSATKDIDRSYSEPLIMVTNMTNHF
ncbi:MAG: hypothetical protein AAGA50_12400 [Pseudomonadota bacterium]